MKLYNLPNKVHFTIIEDDSQRVYLFDHIDGMYSVCYDGDEIFHLAAWTEVECEYHKELMNSSTEYCIYCGEEKRSMSCCEENHFQTYADMNDTSRHEVLLKVWEM